MRFKNKTCQVVIFHYGRQYWFKDDKLHRISNPAIIGKETQIWYKNGSCKGANE